MKKLSLLFFIIIAVFLITGCGKKEESAGNDSKTSETTKSSETTKQEENKDVSLDDNSSFHITYDVNDKEKGMSLNIYRKGNKIKSEMTSPGDNMMIMSSVFYVDKTMFMVTNLGGQKMGMKMDLASMSKKDGKDMDKMLFEAKDNLKNYDKTGTGEVLGYKCDIYKDKEGNTYYFYKDQAVLKMETKSGTMVATKFEPDAKFDDSFFEPPKDIEYMDMGKMDLDKFKNMK